jgi:hypothetical protein
MCFHLFDKHEFPAWMRRKRRLTRRPRAAGGAREQRRDRARRDTAHDRAAR